MKREAGSSPLFLSGGDRACLSLHYQFLFCFPAIPHYPSPSATLTTLTLFEEQFKLLSLKTSYQVGKAPIN